MERAARALLAATLIACAGAPRSVDAQDAAPAGTSSAPQLVPASNASPAAPAPAPAPAATPAAPPAAPNAVQPTPETARIQFNFKDAPFDQVIDFFARECGLPVIFETQPPAATITFISGADYAFDDALSILNLNMARAGVNLRREGKFLYLASIQDASRKASRVEQAKIDPSIKDDQIITVTIPLNNAKSETVAEQIKPLVGPFGSVTAVPQQNMVIIVESAGQCRRIRDIVGAIDAVKPVDSGFRLFPLKYAQCDAVLTAMKGLMGERQKTVVIDKDGQQRVVQDQNLAGLNLASDARTNSIIAVGPEARIRTVEEVIHLLDVPEGLSGETRLTTISLGSISADDAAAKVAMLFAKTPEKSRPNVIPLPASSKIAIVGDAAQVAQASALLAEIDPVQPGAADARYETRAAVIRLKHANAATVSSVAQKLLTPAQLARLKFSPTPDGRGFILAGLDSDVAAFEKLLTVLDSPDQTSREVRVVRISAPVADPAALVRRVKELDIATGRSVEDPIDVTLDEQGRTATLIGSPEAIARFQGLLSQAQASYAAVEARMFPVTAVKASDLATALSNLLTSMLPDGSPKPSIEAIDDIKRLVIRAEPAQFAIIEQLVQNLDTLRPAERPPLRIIQLRNTDAANLAQVLQSSFDQRPGDQRSTKPVSIQADPATNTLIISAHESVWPEIEGIVSKLNEAQQVSATDREVRIFPLKVARAEELAQTLDQMYPEPPAPLDPRTRQPRPDLRPPREVVVRADRGTNSIIVDAPSKRLSGFEQLVRSLDQQKLGESVDVRTYVLKNADPNAVATTIRELASRGALRADGAEVASNTPVAVNVEPTTRSLIVSGPQGAFEPVEKLITKLDAQSELPSTDLKLFPLAHARAERLQPVVQRILSSRLRDSVLAAGKPDTQRLLEVAADAPSNTLIVSAPREILAIADGIITTLDQQSVASAVEVRVFRLSKGQAATIAPALGQSVNAQNAPGEQAITVTAEASSNCVVAVGTSAQLDRAAKLVAQLDSSVDPEGLGVRSIPLKAARAEALAPVVQSLLSRESPIDKLPEWARIQALSRGGNTQPATVRVVADARSNSIVVSGPQPALDLAEKVIASLDIDQGAAQGDRAVRILTLRNADASELATNLEAVLKDDASKEPAATIRVDRSSNTLIVRGSAAQLAQLDALATKLDQASANSGRQLRMVPIERNKADAEMMAQTIRRMLEQQGGIKVQVIPAEKLLDAEKPPTRGGMLLPHMPRGLVPIWMTVQAAAAIDPEPPAEDSDLTIGVDPKTNSLILLGSPRLTDRVSAIAAQLQSQFPSEPTDVKIISLPPGTDAQSIVALLQQTIQQVGRASPQNPGGLTGQVSILPDPSGAALVALSNRTDFEFVSQLVASVLQINARSPLTIKVFPLVNTTASRARQAMLDFVSAQPQGFQSRRIRGLELTLDDGKGEKIKASIDPALIRISADPMGTSLIVAAPAESMPLIDRFVGLIDQSPTEKRLAIRRYELKNARAQELSGTFQQLFDAQRQGPGASEVPQARFIADQRGNAVLVTASDAQHTEVAKLLETADATLDDKDLELALIPIRQSTPSSVRRIVEEVLLGRDPGKRDRFRLSGDDASNILVVRAAREDLEQVRAIVAQVDSSDAAGLPVKSIKLERADAAAVATAIQKFFTDRAAAASGTGRRVQNRVAIFGDKRSGTLVIAAAEDDFEQVKSLATSLDMPADAQAMTFKLIALKNARVSDIEPTIRNIADQLAWERMNGPGQAGRADNERLILEPNARTNSIVLMGTGDAIASAERIIAALDQDTTGTAGAVSVKSVAVGNADLAALKSVVEKALATPGWRSWRGPDPDAVTVEVDRVRRSLVLVGKADRVEQASKIVAELDTSAGTGQQSIDSITLQHAKADRAAATLRQFFSQRSEAQGLPPTSISIIGSPDGNVLILAADPDSLKTLRDLVAQIDQPQEGNDRRIEVYVLKNVGVQEASGTLRAMFPPTTRANERIVVTPQPSTGSLIVSAPEEQFEQLASLIKLLDAPPTAEQTNIATVALGSAKASEVANALKAALPPNIKITITPVARSNTILLTGSNEAIALVSEQIKKIDSEPVKSTQVFRRITLTHAPAEDVFYTLRQMVRGRQRTPDDAPPGIDYYAQDNALLISATAEQMEEIMRIVEQIDVAGTKTRKTEFMKLQYADAAQTSKALELFYGRFAPEAATPEARAVTILPDSASNSLVISADEKEWEGLRALLTKLDTKEYDTSRQLTVIPLRNADAISVARALSEGFRQPLEDQIRRDQARRATPARRDENGRDQQPTIVLGTEGVPAVSAEPQTNALVVFAAQRDLERIEAIVKQLDVPGFANLPTPAIVPLKSGKPTQVAATLREMFIGRLPQGSQSGPRAVAIVGDDASGALIVRADESQLAQIRALADSLTQSGENAKLMPQVVRLANVPAARLRATLLATFQPVAVQMGETLAIEVDRGSNSLVVAASPRLFEQIKRVIEELDSRELGKNPPENGTSQIGQSVTVVDIANNAPDKIKQILDDMGVSKAQPADRPGVVAEPVTIVTLASRQAIAVVGSPADGSAIAEVVKAIDAAPVDAEQKTVVIPLKLASATTLVKTLQQMLSPLAGLQNPQQAAGPSKALAEQVRRLSVVRSGIDQSKLDIDLSRPIRLIADAESNSVVLSTTPGNVIALLDVIQTLDTLPIGEAVVVRIFPLENASATRVKNLIDTLFTQGEQLRRVPGTKRQGLPTTATGKALAGEIAAAIDERTNSLIVAGREEALALVEVLIKDLDSDRNSNWVEPSVIQLKYADATAIADKLREVLVRGLTTSPEAAGLQRQFARLRMVASGQSIKPQGQDADANAKLSVDPARPGNVIEADLFAPVTGLVISADESLNALIVVATPANLGVVRELVAMLDVEAASASNTVRVYPLQFAASERIASIVSDIFRQRERSGAMRPEDRLVISADTRTNAILASTSQRSFSILEGLLKTLDGAQANYSVGLHILPVEGAPATQIAPKIERLMNERLQAAARQGAVRNPLDAFSIEAEPNSNLLIVAASDENLQVVKELLNALTSDASRLAAAEKTELIPVTAGSPADLNSSLRQLYVDKENAKRGPGAVTVVANDRLNAILVSGTQNDIDEIRALVDRLANAAVTTVRDVRRIELRSANALEVVNLLENVLAGRPLGGRGVGQRQVTKVRFLREQVASSIKDQSQRPTTEADIDGAIREQITITPDIRTNSVVVNAPPPMLKLIEELVSDIDQSAAGLRRIETFNLKNADARSMAELLRDTFNLRQQGNSYVLVPARGSEDAPLADGAAASGDTSIVAGTSVTAVPDQRQQLSIAIDARTNTIIVSGTDEYLELVRKVITQLDDIEAQERDRVVYHLRNSKAKEIETTLQSYFRGESSVERQTLGPQLTGSLARVLEREVTIVGDEKSNKLVISTSPRYMDMVLKIVEELDSAPPQVMIEVLLAEVTLDSSDEWGMDISVGPFGNDNYRIGTSAATTGVLNTGLGVPNLSVSSADFGLLVRALQAQGKLEILSNPQVMVNNNQKAKIQVGDNIAIVNGVERLQDGNTRSEVSRRDVGIILNVTPAISNDGFVRMDINPEISQLSARTTQISEDFQAPVINQRTVETTVTVKDGQSVVIGGLIQSSTEDRKTKVPILGDIPIIGLPFQTTSRTARKTELLVILTPRVIPGSTGGGYAEAAGQLSERAVNRMKDLDAAKAYMENQKLMQSPTVEQPGTRPAPAADHLGSPQPSMPEPSPALPVVPVEPGMLPRTEDGLLEPSGPGNPTPYREVQPSAQPGRR
jgi:type II secretion system protein D